MPKLNPILLFGSSRLTGNLEDGLSKALDVVAGDTGDGDTTVLGGVDGVLEVVSICFLRHNIEG